MDEEFAIKLRVQFPHRKKYLIGVSGGRDSVALLHLLHEAGFQKLVLCHLNHQLRGRASGQDAQFVRRLAREYKYDAEVGKAEVRKLAKQRKQSIEVAARRERHEFFARAAAKHRCPRIFLAHHADDQVETVLINLCRGAGLRGLSGMESESKLSVSGRTLQICRPLLPVWRTGIDDYIERWGLKYREDSTNAETAGSTRNQVRHDLIPLLAKIFDRNPREAIIRTSVLASGEDELLDRLLEEAWVKIYNPDETLKCRGVRELPLALQRRAIFRWLSHESRLKNWGFREIEMIREMSDPSSTTAKINLPGRWHARRNRGRIFLQAPE